MTAEGFRAFLEGLRTELRLAQGKKLEEAIDGFVHLRRRLGCPDEPAIDWMSAYQASGFKRKETALAQGKSPEQFKKFLIARKKELGIIARPIRHAR